MLRLTNDLLSVSLSPQGADAHHMGYAPEDDASFFCLELMTDLPNALALQGPQALHLLLPGQSLSGSITFRLSDME